MLGIRSIQNFPFSDPYILFLDDLGDRILQTPNKNDNDKLKNAKYI